MCNKIASAYQDAQHLELGLSLAFECEGEEEAAKQARLVQLDHLDRLMALGAQDVTRIERVVAERAPAAFSARRSTTREDGGTRCLLSGKLAVKQSGGEGGI